MSNNRTSILNYSIVDEIGSNNEVGKGGKESDWNAFIGCVCIVAGAGTLGIPYAIQQGGWITILFLILAAVMTTYANIKFIECLYYNGSSRKNSMSELAYDAFGRIGLVMVGFFSSCISIMCIPYILLKTMKDVALLSLFGVLTVILVVFIVAIISIIDYPDNRENLHDIVIIRYLPISLATVSFSYVLSYSMFTITMLYLIIGFFGYLTYGNNVKSPIYLNLPDGILINIIIISITLHVIFALPIYQTASSLELENYFNINENKLGRLREFIYRSLLRIVTAAMEVYIAISIPYFADVMSLLGALANGTLLVVMPLLLWLRFFGWSKLENKNCEKVWIIFTLMFSITIAIIGSCDAIISIYNDIYK
ncbi:17735_t:CDS:2 [Entrophospora sp. SA101]|nr:16273_t:CDS:2 [Entrophospora sp. SA101]CAJ0749807.1 7553_t:CDS:2 [Entrophospora sp. SA101]CAJ0753411.1 17735_t:CDS:2 [Entrophospora sp. SA101]